MWTIALASVLLCAMAESTLAESAVHPCRRQCVSGEVMTCHYNFTLEWYRTLNKACYDCPFNVTDCYREECIAGDGKVRLVLAVNRQVPGPAIEVCEGDMVEVRVTNMLEDGLSTSIHWHGQHVFREAYFDGVGQVTQCNIQHQETFVYKFHAGPEGTHWYHAHTGMQLADGAFGPVIVRQPAGHDLNDNLYDQDLSEHVMMVYNWHPVLSMEYYLNLMYAYDPFSPQSVMVNGRARHYNVTNSRRFFDSNLTHAQTPPEVVHVRKGERYRLRFISASPACPLQVSVDQHQLTVISVDGMPVVPRVLDAFIIHPGERYDVVLNAQGAVTNYWLRVLGLGDCEGPKANGMAVVRYEGAGQEDPPGDPSLQRDGILLNPILYDGNRPEYGFNRTKILTDDLRYILKTNYTDEQVDVKYFIGMDFNNNDNTKYNNKDLYPVQSLKPQMFHATPVMDNITFITPPVPPISQREDVDEAWFCNRSTLQNPEACLTEDLCMCVHVIHVPLDKVVELIVFHEGRFFAELGHNMHLHGHSFRLLGLEKLGESLNRTYVEDLDRLGQLKRNFLSPSVRDTVNVPDGGYVVLRFLANNPGLWFFHCHTDSHLQQGMALLIKVGELSDLPPVPADFPRCGGMGYSNANRRQPTRTCPVNSAGGGPQVSVLLLSVLCVMLGMF
ncbi:uncharacterized protein LOC143301231 [Babylonia areolata]|uniref:uncharacterized protein LOC143301231 n=1 Tax=Babylonia areolata TaxID=304850 RepID=UPI003FD353F8